jgi:hypothetical protein
MGDKLIVLLLPLTTFSCKTKKKCPGMDSDLIKIPV